MPIREYGCKVGQHNQAIDRHPLVQTILTLDDLQCHLIGDGDETKYRWKCSGSKWKRGALHEGFLLYSDNARPGRPESYRRALSRRLDAQVQSNSYHYSLMSDTIYFRTCFKLHRDLAPLSRHRPFVLRHRAISA